MNIFERVENVRKKLNLSKGEICERLGIGRTMLHYLKNGVRDLKPSKMRVLEDLEYEAGLREPQKNAYVVREERPQYETSELKMLLKEIERLKKKVETIISSKERLR